MNRREGKRLYELQKAGEKSFSLISVEEKKMCWMAEL